MIREKLIAVRDRMEDTLRSWMGRITPDGRLALTLVMLFLFSATSICTTVSTIYCLGKRKGYRMRIDPIERPESVYKVQRDSINQIKPIDYE